MELAVIGCGYVGLVSSACLAEIGHDVICVDSDEKKIAALEGGDIPIHEEFVPELLQRHHGRRLTFSTSLAEAVERSSVVFIAVGTPAASNGEADLSYVEEVARGIAHSASEPMLIVEKSTVPVYTCEWIRQVSRLAGKQKDIEVVSNPEFLREGTAVTDFFVSGPHHSRSRQPRGSGNHESNLCTPDKRSVLPIASCDSLGGDSGRVQSGAPDRDQHEKRRVD